MYGKVQFYSKNFANEDLEIIFCYIALETKALV